MGIVRARDDSCTNACAGKARSRGTRCRDVIVETLWVTNPIRPRSAAMGHAPQSFAKAASERIRSGLSPKGCVATLADGGW